MAYTKIHAIKSTVDKAIAYICNPDKTDESMLISSFACSPETAHFDFKFALSKTNQSDANKAYHLIQSFSPGEVDFQEAHTIGEQLADRLLGEKYSYIVATHIDKEHCHNHIIFCAADNITHKKYNDCKQSYYNIRNISDNLCKEHNLSIIIPGQKRGLQYTEWLANNNNTSWKTQIKKDIDDTIKSCNTYDHFILLMKAKGYEIKGEELSADSLKYISFKPLGKERFVRGSAKSLGAEYTKESINKRINERLKEAEKAPKRTTKTQISNNNKKIESRTSIKDLINKKSAKNINFLQDKSERDLIDTSQDKFQENPYLKRWANIQNLKTAASIYSKSGSNSDIEKKIAEQESLISASKDTLVTIDRQLKELGEVIKYVDQYKTNKKFNTHYKQAKDKELYFRKHESQLILYAGAKTMLQRKGIDLSSIDLNSYKTQYNELINKKNQLQDSTKSIKDEINSLKHKLNNLNQYTGIDINKSKNTERE